MSHILVLQFLIFALIIVLLYFTYKIFDFIINIYIHLNDILKCLNILFDCNYFNKQFASIRNRLSIIEEKINENK